MQGKERVGEPRRRDARPAFAGPCSADPAIRPLQGVPAGHDRL